MNPSKHQRKRQSLRRSRGLNMEKLEARQMLAANPIINEFLARNDGGLRDGDGRSSDWIEIFNSGDQPVDLSGYHLTDDGSDQSKWTFPSSVLEPGEYLVVFASGQDEDDYVDEQGNLHTNFTLQRSGEYLALVSPSGATLSEFGSSDTDYPEQLANVSYGRAQRIDLITPRSDVLYAVPVSTLIDGTWMMPSFDATGNGFLAGKAAIGFETQPTSRSSFVGLFQTELPENSHAVYARYEFTLSDAAAIRGLQLDLQYDDGFIAYLNGQRVLSENAPDLGTSFSTSLERRADSDVLVPQAFDLIDATGLLVNGTNVLAIHGLNHLSDRSDFLIVPTLRGASGGELLADGTPARVGYMNSPSPGGPNSGNSEVFEGFIEDTKFSQNRGFFDEPFTVEISTASPDAQIRYTVDGSAPTITHGTLYEGPISITTTTTLRAAAFKDGFLPTDVDTNTYIFPDDVLKQPDNPAGFPDRWGNAGAADYGMDSRITTDTSSPYYSPLVRDALFSHPTISLVADNVDLWDPRTGIYSNPQSQGVQWERPVSMEYFDPNSGREIQVNAGLRIQGGASRNPNREKHNMRLLFKGDYGPTKLRFPLFDTTEVDEFDTFILRGQNGDSWFHPQVTSRDPQYIRDQWLRETQREMGRPAPAQGHVHLYINGLYWGFYNIIEKPNASFFAEHFGGEKEEYDVIQHQGGTVDGNRDVWNEMMAIARAGLETNQAVEAVEQYIDLSGMIDYLLINFYAGNVDWDQNNWFGGRRRTEDGRFIFFTWDAERTFLNINENVTTKNILNQPTEVHQRLRANDEYRLRFADHVHRHFFNNGLLTPEQVEARWMRWADEIELALWAEAARFGDAKRNEPYTPDVQWVTDLNKFREDFFPRRTDIVLDQLRRQDLYPDIVAPSFSRHGGFVTSDFSFTMSAPEGTIYYMVDGRDPRLPGGAVLPGAVVYSGPVSIGEGATVKARVWQDGEWSALNEATFQIASDLPLRVTELNFNPHPHVPESADEEAIDSDRFEYIEVTNVSSQTIDLAGVTLQQVDLNGRIQGIRFQFDQQSLPPHESVVAVRDRDAFTSRYGEGVRIAAGADGEDGNPGKFGGNLANQGEQITLVDAGGRIIQQFAYGFSGDWPARANGRGSSLEVVDPLGDPSDPANWRASLDFGGSPSTAGSAASSSVVFNELLTNPLGGGDDQVELRNMMGPDIDIGGWYLTDSDDEYLRYRIPDATILPASGFVVLSGAALGFDLDGRRGGFFQLIDVDANGQLSRFVDRVTFSASFPGVSLGPSSADASQWIALDGTTLGAANSGPFVPDVVITEIVFNPVDPDGEGRGFNARDFQYVELTNHTDQPSDISQWELGGDFVFAFPDATVLAPGETIIVTRFRPTDVGKLAVMQFTAGLPRSTQVFGRVRSSLPSDEGTVKLLSPLDPSGRNSPLVAIEEVHYGTTPPWADTSVAGQSLNRTRAQDSASSPASWLARDATPGTHEEVEIRIPGDANLDGFFDRLDIIQVLQRGKYQTGQPASWEDGDWDGDGDFDRLDLVFALQDGQF